MINQEIDSEIFNNLVKKVIEAEYGVELVEDKVINIANVATLFNYADLKKNIYVDIKENGGGKYRKQSFDQTLNTITDLIKENKESRYFKVFKDELSNEDIKYYNRIFEIKGISGERLKVLDRTWIIKAAIDNKIGDYGSENTDENQNKDNQKLEDLINSDKNFFAAGHSWGDNNNKWDYFIENGIWENGHEDKLVNVVNRAKVGDVIFLKSTVRKGSVGNLRIKAIGVVADNPKDGHKLYVNWNIIKEIDLPGLGGVMSAINQIGEENVKKTLKGLHKELPELFDIIERLDRLILSNDPDVEQTPITKRKEDLSKEVNRRYWWIRNDSLTWSFIDQKPGSFHTLESFSKSTGRREVYGNFFKAKKGDFIIGFQGTDRMAAVTILEVQQEISDEFGGTLGYNTLKVFNDWAKWDDITELVSYSSSPLSKNTNADFHELPYEQFIEILELTDFDISELGKLNEVPQGDRANSSEIEIPTKKTKSISSTSTSNDLAFSDKDLLGFEADVKVFASLIALKDLDPPLAISLFGNWGMGKSFFMHHLERKIKELSEYQGFIEEVEGDNSSHPKLEGGKYCEGIAHIKFNAWSYLDSNLWAGLVTTIFEKLDEYLTDSTKSGVAKLKVKEKLTERLLTLKSSSFTAGQRISGLELLQEEYKLEIENLENKIQTNFTHKLLEVFRDDGELKTLHENLTKENPKITEVIGIQNTKIVSEYYFWREVWGNLKQSNKLIKYLIFALIIVASLIGLNYYINEVISNLKISLITIITPILAYTGLDGRKIFSKYKSVKKYVKKVNKFLQENNNLEKNITQLEKLFKTAGDEIDEANQEIKQLEIKINSLEYRIGNNLAQETIGSFINERANHSDYKDHLGIVSIIRKDFETLSELFLESWGKKPEEKKKNEDATLIGDKSKEDTIKSDRKIIKDQFKKDKNLERIILYIDDLDRCSDEKVLEVLQAVHLLMAFPLFIVVVGVDKRCVNNALNYQNILKYYNSTNAKDLDDLKTKYGIKIIQPNEYLEKIFQIPFQIPEAEELGIHQMIEELFSGQKIATIADEDALPEDEKEEVFQKMEESIAKQVNIQNVNSLALEINVNEDKVKEDIQSDESKVEEPEEEYVHKTEEKVIGKRPVTPPDLTITEIEIEQIKQFSTLVGKTPRTIKRFVNLYRILRAHGELAHDALSIEEKLAIMLILSVNVGENKDKSEKLFKELKEGKNKTLDKIITKNKYPLILEVLNRKNGKGKLGFDKLMKIKCDVLAEQIPFVERFSFGDMLLPNMHIEEELNKD